jgi:antitoxin component YwqK of YwqJK toxin-antitoxin module
MNVINFFKFIGTKNPNYEFDKVVEGWKAKGRFYPYSGKGEYVNGVMNGRFERYVSNNDNSNELYLSGVKNYNNGDLHGDQITYYPNGQILKIQQYVNGYEDGMEKTYFSNGELKYSAKYNEGRKTGLEVSFNENGGIVSKITWVNSRRQGEEINNYYSGKPHIRGYYENGYHQGPYKEYWENGNLKIDGTYNQGNYVGKYVKYYSNGNIETTSLYDSENKSKHTIDYRKEGGKEYETIKDDKFTTVMHYYGGNEQLQSIKTYDNDTSSLTGPYEAYDSNGNLTSKYLYKNNRVVQNTLKDEN